MSENLFAKEIILAVRLINLIGPLFRIPDIALYLCDLSSQLNYVSAKSACLIEMELELIK